MMQLVDKTYDGVARICGKQEAKSGWPVLEREEGNETTAQMPSKEDGGRARIK